MGRRQRQRAREDRLVAPNADYVDAEGNVLTLRGSMTPATRRAFAAIAAGNVEAVGASAAREDAWHRGGEFLFERLAVRWTIAGAPLEHQKQLLARFRAASSAERAWVRDVIRDHCRANFPELPVP